MTKKNIFTLFGIVFLGFLLRIWCLDKPQGLWNDEYIGWFISSRSFPFEFIKEAARNCHMPFYYLYLKLWMSIFSDSDLSLRFSSVLTGTLSIVSMYFVGKEYKDHKLGLLCAAFSSLSGFLIYFSQEVRLYSLLFLLASINALIWIKLSKEQSKKNFVYFGVINFLIIITHTLGFIFVFFNLISMGIYLMKINREYKEPIKKIVIFMLAALILLSPFIYKIFKESYVSQFWSGFSFAKVFFTFTDYFSPIQINIINTPKYVYEYFFKGYNLNYMFIVFAAFPTIMAAFGILRALTLSDKRIKYLFFVACSYLVVLTTAASFNRIVLATKYSVEMYPILILFMCIGFLNFKKESVQKIFITSILLIPMVYYLVNNNSTPKLGRPEGNKIVMDMLKVAKIKPTDKVLLTYYDPEKFEKYSNGQKYQMYFIDKYNFPTYIVNQKYTYKTIVINGKILFYDNLRHNDTSLFEKKFYNTLVKNMKKGDRLAIVFLKSVSFFDEVQMKKITSDVQTYHNTPFLFMVFSYVKNNSLAVSSKYLKLKTVAEEGDWLLFVFQKQ